MFLKSITLYGFKSFAQDTRIVLKPGISVIVGPNGGGKSNVIDAIRWALGEQRIKELRADRWEDLLHTDSNNRRAKMVEVSLLFDNDDKEMDNWPESLQITRRYYLSGDSEYLLNGRVARLKDVVDLFLNSGIGRFNYAIIGQGRVEQALLMKPKDRLEQLEEAAGVSRYKVKRRETFQHLSDVQRNLDRLSDLIADVRDQKEQIEEEAQIEKTYLDIQHRHHDLQMRYQLTHYLQAIRDQTQWQDAVQEMYQRRAELETELQTLRTERDQRSRIREQMTERLDSLVSKVDANRGSLAVIDTHIARLEAEQEGLNREIEGLKEQGLRIDRQLADLGDKFTELASATTTGGDEDPVKEDRYRELESMKNALNEKVRTLEQKKQEQEQQEHIIRDLSEETRRLERHRDRLEGALQLASHEDLLTRVANWESEESTLRNQQTATKVSYDKVSKTHKAVKQELTLVIQGLNQAQQDLWEYEAQSKALRSVESSAQTMPSSVRAVLEISKNGQIDGILGTLGSLMTIPAALQKAMDVALSAQRHYVLTDTESHARQVVNWLKRQRAGRVTLLPLDQIRPAHIPERDRELDNQPGVVGWALDQVDFDAKLFPAVSYVLGRVLVIESLEVGHRVGRLHQFRYRMVSLDGQVILTGGAISGGSDVRARGNADKLIAIAERVVQLKDLVTNKKKQQQELEEELQQIATKEQQLRQTLDSYQERINHLHRILQGGEVNTQAVTNIMTAMKNVESRLKEARHTLDSTMATIHTTETELEELKEVYQSGHQEYLRSQEVESHRLELMTYYREESRQFTLQKEELERRLDQLQHSVDTSINRMALRHEERVSKNQEIEGQEQEVHEIQEQLHRLEDSLKANEIRNQTIMTEDRKAIGRINYLEQQLLKITTKWDGYDPPDKEPLENDELPEARRRLDEWQNTLDSLGVVHRGVYALFTQLLQRLEYLETERQDVERSASELRETLHQIDQEVDLRVTETAERVETAFAQACLSLLGGKAGFRWMEGEERGVDLWITPPGKKPGTLTLLSGGEKALGGISWLFALLSVRPSPLVVLDEVEAALDEANARKVAEYIRRHRGNPQYVIVTHHKSTMTIADALWGVAGDGKGRSRLVSVQVEQMPEVKEG